VDSAAFKAVGCGDPTAAGSIPVRLRYPPASPPPPSAIRHPPPRLPASHRAGTMPRVTGMENQPHPPSVDRLSRMLADTGLPAPILVQVARVAIAEAVEMGEPASAEARARTAVQTERRRLLQPVINATGVLLHTNLGRAPITVERDARYTNLEIDLATGRRGSRSAHAPRLMAMACGAEAALVVNNGASAVLLVLAALAGAREVVVSRGELVEIGGGFRLPEVLAASGARLVEVGTTNRTRRVDYERATGPECAMLLKVHTSNFRVTGFTESVSVTELVEVSSQYAGPVGQLTLPVVVDLGSGLLDAACPWLDGGPPGWLRDEPAVRQTLAAGAALVTFSCDKLLGGPQAGVIAGRAELVERCRGHPLARALRTGGLVLECLQEVVMAYLRRDAGRTVPLWHMATCPLDVLRQRAGALGRGDVVDCDSVIGGGALPGRTIPSAGVAVPGDVTARLRAAEPPVLARVRDGQTICDLRTVFPEQDKALGRALSP
jgi:L-seryl-tRNA(Ser) seleniumtransferase